MEKTLYDMMDWAGIEELVYSEASDPHRLLGAHETEQGVLVQVFIPTAEKVQVNWGRKQYEMELADEAGFFAVLIPEKKISAYTLTVTYDNETVQEIRDPYAYGQQIPEEKLKEFAAGVCYDIYETLGAHGKTIDGVEGVLFAVWAPCAMRVSVVGDFNLGEIGAVAVDDICMGYFHDYETPGNNAVSDIDDSRGNRMFAGFCTIYFRITEILDAGTNKRFRYVLRGVSDRWQYSFHPCEALHFVAYGNFTNKERQTSAYETRTYRRFLVGVNDWEFTKSMVAMQDGDLSNLNIFGLDMTGYSAYLNNIYMTGTIEQLQIDAPVRIEIDTQGDNFLAYGESMEITCKVFKGWEDITDTVRQWAIRRDSGDTADDEAWNIKHKDFNGSITIHNTKEISDLGNNSVTVVSTLFTITATNDTASVEAIVTI